MAGADFITVPSAFTKVTGEAQLIDALRAGDERAFAALVDQHTPAMLRVARGYVPSREIAEEVVQEAWIAMLKGIGRFEGRSSLRAGFGIFFDRIDDNVTLLAMAQRWPPATWFSLKERALYQARRLDTAAARSGGRLTVVRSRSDLAAFLRRRRAEPGIVAGLLGLEGAHALEDDPANLGALFAAGFRMVGLVHFFDNELGGSAHGVRKGGLTAKGRDLVRGLEERRMLLDLAHASPDTIHDALAAATRPVVVSHTGVRGTCDNGRNLDDDALRGVARTGGLVGIGFWQTAVCGTGGPAVARAIRYASGVAGIDHVALGSDFDGAVAEPFDATGLVEVTDALLAEGFTEAQVEQVMGGNVFRLLAEALP